MTNDKIKDNLYPLYDCYAQYKLLYEFYQSFKNMKNINDIKERLEYLKKNPQVKQKTELECLMWLLNVVE